MDIEQLKSQFADPPSRFTPAPFWFLNHELTDEELRWQIREMHSQGVKGFILHGRHGLITEYLSDEWFARIETCIKEADKLGMKAYLYDENNWPSGPVDGVLLKNHPEYRMSACTLTGKYTVAGGKRLRQKLDLRDGLICVVAVPTERDQLVGLPNSALLLHDYVSDNALDWEAPSDAPRYSVFVFARTFLTTGTFFGGYLDTLNKDAVGKFIEMTHKPYAQRFSRYFGGTVDGIFTDEPAILIPHATADMLPYTPALVSEFGWRHGYEFYRVLPAIFVDAGEHTAQLRCDFYDTVSHLYEQAYFKQIYDYCDPLRLNSIGHVLYEGETYECHRYQGDYFRGAQHMHWSGCDELCDITWPIPGRDGYLNNLVGPKLASSAAHHFLKPRVMSECFGIAGDWHIDIRTLKCLADWLIAMGVNQIQPHAFYYSIQGERKWECPPGEFYQSAFWPYYKYFADYASRICSVFTDADHVADVAVLYPTRSMWATINPDRTDASRKVARDFELVTAALVKAGYDFDLVSEEILINDISSACLENLASGESYKALVIPTTVAMLAETADFIAQCAESGVNVILAGDPPEHILSPTGAAWSDEEWSEDIFMEQFGSIYDSQSRGLAPSNALEAEASAVHIASLADMDEERLASAFTDVFAQLFDADVRILDARTKHFISDIVHCHYRHGEDEFYFFANTARDRSFKAQISLDAIGVPSIWNAETGDVVALQSYDYDGQRTTFELAFQPCESYVIGVSTLPVGEEVIEIEDEPKYSKTIQLSQQWEFTTEKPNVLPLVKWQFSMANHAEGQYAYGWHCYTAEFDCDAELTVARLAVDGLLTEKIWLRSQNIHVDIKLNDQPVSGFEQGTYIDHLIMEADILPHIKRGRNILQIWCNSQLAPAGSLEHPVYVLGDFEVRNRAGKSVIVPASVSIETGDWTTQGYPFYSGVGVYTQTVKLPRTTKRVYLRMDRPGDLAEIMVNGEFAAVLPWEPWAADITDLVRTGDNEITIKVANAMANLFLMKPKPSGILGKVEIAIAT